MIVNNEKILITYDDLVKEYMRAKKHIGFYYDTNVSVFQVSGDKAFELINSLSCTKIYDPRINNFYTLVTNKTKLYGEVLVIKLSCYKYLIFSNNFKRLFKIFRNRSKKYPVTTINDVSNHYSLFSFHGNEANDYFNEIKYKNLYKTTHQNYTYYQLIARKKDANKIVSHFNSIQFSQISLETKSLFLYNNNVVLNLEKLPRMYRWKICKKLYNFGKIKRFNDDISIGKFEIDKKIFIPKNKYIYNVNRKRSGIIQCCYFIPNKKFPFVLCLISNKIGNTAFIKLNKEEIFIRRIPTF